MASTIWQATETDRRIDVYRRAFDIVISVALLLLTFTVSLPAWAKMNTAELGKWSP